MDTSRSTGSSPKSRQDLRDRLYYDRHEWCIDFRCIDAFCLKLSGRDLDAYQNRVRQRWHWRNAARLRSTSNRVSYNHGGSWHVVSDGRDAQHLERLMQLARLVWCNAAIKPIFYYNWVYLYTSDLDHALHQLAQLALPEPASVRRAVINRERGTILRRDPQHDLRSYLREHHITAEQKQALKNFLRVQEDISMSPSLESWLQDSNLWLRSHFYVDHMAQSLRLMIEIITPGILGRCVRIVAINTA